MGSMKNYDLFPIGTRVKIAHAKTSKRIGTVIEYTEDGEGMVVHWDGDPLYRKVPFSNVAQLRKATENEEKQSARETTEASESLG